MVSPAEKLSPIEQAFKEDDPELKRIIKLEKSKRKIELRKLVQKYGDMARDAKNDIDRETFQRWQASAQDQLDMLEK